MAQRRAEEVGAMKHRWRLAAVLAALALMVAACGGDGDTDQPSGGAAGDFAGTTITMSVAFAPSEKAALQEVLDKFKAQTGATVNLTTITAQDLPGKLQVETTSGNHTIHLFAQDNLALATLVDSGYVEDLSSVEVPDGVTEALIP